MIYRVESDRKRNMWKCHSAFALVLWVLSVGTTRGGDTQIDRSTLKGLDSISVLCDIDPIQEKFGVTCQQILTDVELRLRKAGVKIDETKTLSYLYVNVNVVDSGVDTYAVGLEI